MDAIVIVGHVTWAIGEGMKGNERSESAESREATTDLIVGVVVGEVRDRPVGCQPRDVGPERVPILSTVNVEIGRITRQATKSV